MNKMAMRVKRKRNEAEEKESGCSAPKRSNRYASIIASHYNQIKETGWGERSQSPILGLRNFHNQIKSMLINKYLLKIKNGMKYYNAPIKVLDLCCGKGGDLSKWRRGNITHLICADIASVALEDCKRRYDNYVKDQLRRKGKSNSYLFSIEYIEGDCTSIRLRSKFSDPSIKLDLVSCQFALQYCFESSLQTECMLRNASECLKPGGYFIGTIPDANEIISRARKNESFNYGNSIYEVKLDFSYHNPPLFGAKYIFNLEGCIKNCPEFLVHFPTLVELAKKFGLKLLMNENFHAFFDRLKSHNIRLGTLSRSEWEASTLYTTFVFEKVKNIWTTDGTAIYDIDR